MLVELAHQPALADAGRAEHGHQLRRALADDVVQGVGEQPQLVVAADHGDRVGVLVHLLLHRRDASQTSVGFVRPRRVNGGWAAKRISVRVADWVPVDQHTAGGAPRPAAGRRCSPRRRPRWPAHRRGPPRRRRAPRRSRCRPGSPAAAPPASGQGPLQVQPGPHAAHGVGLGRHRRAEQHHRRVADVLLDHAAVLAHDPAHGAEEVVSGGRGPSPVGLLGEAGEAAASTNRR